MEEVEKEEGGGLSKRAKNSLTGVMCFCYFSFGLGFSLFGPTLIDLKETLGSSVSDVSYGLVTRSAVYCFGSLFCGWAFNVYNRQVTFALCLLGCGLSTMAIPFLGTLTQFLVVQGAVGFTAGGIDAASNAWLLEIWQEQSNPYMQGMHFFWALGSTVAPLLSEPFLSPDRNHTLPKDDHNTSNAYFFLNSMSQNETSYESRIHIPYVISGVIMVLAATIVVAFYYISPYKAPLRYLGHQRKRVNLEMDSEDTQLLPINLPKSYYYSIIGFGSLLLCFYMGIEMNSFTFLQTFAVHIDLKLSKSKGAFLSSAIGASYTICRGLSIYLATRVKTHYMLYVDFVVITIGNALLLFYANTSETMVWISVIMIGAGFASVYPALYSFLEERINVTNSVCGFFMFASSLATTVNPLIEGRFIETHPLIYVHINIISIAICVVLFVCLHSTDRVKRSYTQKSS